MMEYQKIINSLIIHQINHLNLDQKIDDESQGMYKVDNKIKFKTSM